MSIIVTLMNSVLSMNLPDTTGSTIMHTLDGGCTAYHAPLHATTTAHVMAGMATPMAPAWMDLRLLHLTCATWSCTIHTCTTHTTNIKHVHFIIHSTCTARCSMLQLTTLEGVYACTIRAPHTTILGTITSSINGYTKGFLERVMIYTRQTATNAKRRDGRRMNLTMRKKVEEKVAEENIEFNRTCPMPMCV